VVSLRVTCAAAATAYAIALLAAEITVKPAAAARDWAALERAGLLGFGKYWLRGAAARAVILSRGTSDIALPAIHRALATDPHSADLLAMQMKYQLAAGDPDGATESFRKLHRLAPNAASVKAICGSSPTCDVRFVPQ
jgi:hypothetical protein